MLPNACPKPRPKVRPPKGMRKKNAARQKDEFARCYHSRARQKFVNLLPCACCAIWGHSENAHVMGSEGRGRKAHYTTIAPLCGPRYGEENRVYEGCHAFSHRDPTNFKATWPLFVPRRAARDTERKWQSFLRSSSQHTEETSND